MSNGWRKPATKPQEYEERPLCPPGTFPAAVVGVLELGTHTEDTDYGETDRQKLAIVYELAVPQPNGEQFLFAEYLTFSEYTTSNFYKRYSTIMGIPPIGSDMNPTQLLGRPCGVSIEHREGGKRQTRTYANLAEVIPPLYGQQPYQPRRQPTSWATFEGTPPPDLSWVPSIYGKSLKSIIESSHEARAGKFPLGSPTNQPPNQQHQRTSPPQQPPQPQYQQQPTQPQYQQPQYHQQPQQQPPTHYQQPEDQPQDQGEDGPPF